MIRNLLFDLDGTIIDSADSISWTFIETAKEFSDIKAEQSDVIPLLGGFRLRVFEDIFHLDGDTLWAAKKRYGVLINSVGYKRELLYDGIRELLDELHQMDGIRLYVCSARVPSNSIISLKHHELFGHFKHVMGPTGPGAASKSDVLREEMAALNLDPRETVMIGDMVGDIKAGKDCGTKTIALSYGFGRMEDMMDIGADSLAHTVMELREILLNMIKEENS
ncbi:MAG: HAD family hydrolase [Clostridiales bacterium]|nr:HAD family hydrolase [Clostridiales bacterium]